MSSHKGCDCSPVADTSSLEVEEGVILCFEMAKWFLAVVAEIVFPVKKMKLRARRILVASRNCFEGVHKWMALDSVWKSKIVGPVV